MGGEGRGGGVRCSVQGAATEEEAAAREEEAARM
jgi:hypothetical protein